MIVDNTISLIEYLHENHYIHRDIKPENFLMGMGHLSHVVYMVDYGLTQRYRDANTLAHIKFREDRPITGTARYLSLNGHYGIESSRRDDLESLGYMYVYLLTGNLPWKKLTENNDQKDKVKKIA